MKPTAIEIAAQDRRQQERDDAFFQHMRALMPAPLAVAVAAPVVVIGENLLAWCVICVVISG